MQSTNQQKKLLILKLFDIEKFCDKEMIHDAVLTCKKRGVDEKAIRVWYKLNEEKNKIRVKTGAGTSKYAEVGAVLGQGTRPLRKKLT